MVTFEVDQQSLNELINGLDGFINSINDFSEPLHECGQLVLDEVQKNFDQEGYYYDPYQKWADLADATIEDRINQGYPGEHPILERTGDLKGSFREIEHSNDHVTVGSVGVFYAPYHQTGTYKMPARPVIGTTNKSRKAIGLVIANFIAKHLGEYFQSGNAVNSILRGIGFDI